MKANMSDTPEIPTPTQPVPTETPVTTPAPSSLSRRDFLRRASRDAVETGGRIVPGAGVAKAVMGTNEKPGLLQKFAEWRTKRTDTPDPTTPETPSASTPNT